ncbi:hypothetical protein U9M48_024883 [Paspalum notatum var. saurae]|uniref:RING-type E3 ubiquitin transferase n=1 Tax=Paspalum notatum var. saurae TaxID=547442 RepID=A0AAQ3WX12_PASNO
MLNLYPRLQLQQASSVADAAADEYEVDGYNSAFYGYGIAVVCVTIFVFCALVSSVSVWKACAFASLAALLLTTAGCFAPKRWFGRRRSQRGTTPELVVVTVTAGGAAQPGYPCPRVIAPPAFAFDCPLQAGCCDGGEPAASCVVCSVCLEDVRGGEMVRQVPACRHIFHVGCIDMWLLSHRTCPMCRCVVSPVAMAVTPKAAAAEEAPGLSDDEHRDLPPASSGAADDENVEVDGNNYNPFYGIAVVCVSIFIFCVLAASMTVWKALAFAALAALLLGVAGCFFRPLALSRRGGSSASASAEQVVTVTAATAAPAVLPRYATAQVDAPPAFAFQQCPRLVAGGGGGEPPAASCVVCSVCLEDVRGGEMVPQVPACRHIFHVGCIDMWMNSHRTCPMCRCVISPVATAATPKAAAEEPSESSDDEHHGLPPVSRGFGAAAEYGDDGVTTGGNRACYAIAAIAVALLLFCALAASVSVWMAFAFGALALVAFGVAGCFVPAPTSASRRVTAEGEAGDAAGAAAERARRCRFGLPKAAIDALPTFAYELNKRAEAAGGETGDGGDLEAADGAAARGGEPCSVCLEDILEGEVVRQLPACKHLFHVECVDMWLHSHRTCPVCRCNLLPPQQPKVVPKAAAAPPAAAAEAESPAVEEAALPPV